MAVVRRMILVSVLINVFDALISFSAWSMPNVTLYEARMVVGRAENAKNTPIIGHKNRYNHKSSIRLPWHRREVPTICCSKCLESLFVRCAALISLFRSL